MYRTVYALILAVFVNSVAAADDEVDPDRNFNLPGAEAVDFVGNGGINLEDVDFVGSPLKRRPRRCTDPRPLAADGLDVDAGRRLFPAVP